jgi:hypothetical protein
MAEFELIDIPKDLPPSKNNKAPIRKMNSMGSDKKVPSKGILGALGFKSK